MTPDRSFWLFIEPYVHMTFQAGDVLFYNTLNKKMVVISDQPVIVHLCRMLSKPSNNYTIEISEEELNNPVIHSFIKLLRKSYLGDLLKQSWSDKKPVMIVPNPLIKKHETGAFVPDAETLRELILHISSSNSGLVRQYNRAYAQFVFPYATSGKKKELDLRLLKVIIDETRSFSKMTFDLVADDILKYSQLRELLSMLETVNHQKRFYFFPMNFNAQGFDIPQKNSTYILLLTHPFSEANIDSIIKSLYQTRNHIPVEWHFIVRDSYELVDANRIIQNLHLKNIFFKPYFTGSNYSFFRDYVFIDKNDIDASKPDEKHILARKMINETEWGKLTILPGGKVFANVNDEPLGNLKKDSINDLIRKEANNGISWKRIRSSAIPCKNCLYHLLCPPISNYELVMKKFNLCHLVP